MPWRPRCRSGRDSPASRRRRRQRGRRSSGCGPRSPSGPWACTSRREKRVGTERRPGPVPGGRVRSRPACWIWWTTRSTRAGRRGGTAACPVTPCPGPVEVPGSRAVAGRRAAMHGTPDAGGAGTYNGQPELADTPPLEPFHRESVRGAARPAGRGSGPHNVGSRTPSRWGGAGVGF